MSCTKFADSAERLLMEQEQYGRLPAAMADHLDACAVCAQEAQVYASLRIQLQGATAPERPATNYQAKVFARIEQRAQSNRRSRALWLLAAPIAIAALWFLLPSADDQLTGIDWKVIPTGQSQVRGDNAHIDDDVQVRVTAGENVWTNARLYRGSTFLRSCTDSLPCKRRAQVFEATFRLAIRGVYRVMVVTGVAVELKGENFDTDLATAETAGAVVHITEAITVR